MNKKITNVSRLILSIIIIIDVIFITSSIVFDFSADFYQKILIFDIITCVLLLFDFFWQFFKSDDENSTLRTTGWSL